MRKTIFRFSDFIADIFFPNRCQSCERVIAWNAVFCAECAAGLEYINGALPQLSFVGEQRTYFDHTTALFWYDGTAKEAILSLKRHRSVKFARFCAEGLVKALQKEDIGNIDIVTAVPMHRKKRRDRGYNQAELIAYALSERLGTEHDFTLLRHSEGDAQHGRRREERLAAAEETYSIADKTASLDGKSVLLCDDIMTTGATVNACARLLKEMGAQKVYVAVVCRTNNKGNNE